MRAAILILAFLIPAAAAADDTAAAPAAEAAAVTSAQPARPAVGPPEPKRRASMVGYIDDATIDDHVRLRLDFAWNNDVPDRAEFFYAQCGCNFAGAPGPGNPGAGDLVTRLNFQQVFVDGQYAFKRRGRDSRIAVFASVPLRFIQPQTFLGQTFNPPLPNTFKDSSGLADVRVGAKVALISDEDSTLTVQVQGYFPTGDAKQGLGTNHGAIEFSVLNKQTMSKRAEIELEVGDWVPTGGSTAPPPNGQKYSGNVFYYGVGPSYELVNTGRITFAPVIELVGWHVFGGQQQNSGSLQSAEGTNIVNLKFGARTIFDNRSSFYVGYGQALTDAVWYRHILRFEYRYSF
jgi:hypothetical protein